MLKVIRFDEDTGLHKKVCKGIEFPNALVIDIQGYDDHSVFVYSSLDAKVVGNIEREIGLNEDSWVIKLRA